MLAGYTGHGECRSAGYAGEKVGPGCRGGYTATVNFNCQIGLAIHLIYICSNFPRNAIFHILYNYMNTYKNEYLREVVCTFRFKEDSSKKWDSGYFGQFYDKIKSDGFTERREQKGIQVNVEQNPDEPISATSSISEGESQMIFQDPSLGRAITMGNKHLSFHIIANYTTWENFIKSFLNPVLTKYLELGIYSKAEFCQVLYLSQFNFEFNTDISKYFNIISPQMPGFGLEGSSYTQRQYIDDSTKLGLVIKINSTPLENGTKFVNCECGAVSLLSEENSNLALLDLAQKVRGPIRNFFEHIITNELREIL